MFVFMDKEISSRNFFGVSSGNIEKKGCLMPKPELQDLKPYILKQLKRNVNIDNIVLYVCERTGDSWQSVNEYIIFLSDEHKDDIVLSQSPVLIGLAFVMLLFGVGVFANILYEIYWIYMENPQDIISFILSELRLITAGSIMIIGSITGMKGVWESILKKTGIL